MKALVTVAILLLPAVSCLDFGEDISTENPTDGQLQYCITVMHINPEVQIFPTGLVIMASGIDDAIWFRFETPVSDHFAIFEEAHFPPDSFRGDIVIYPPTEKPEWWDAGERELNGWRAELPGGIHMTVGLESFSGGTVCHVFWMNM